MQCNAIRQANRALCFQLRFNWIILFENLTVNADEMRYMLRLKLFSSQLAKLKVNGYLQSFIEHFPLVLFVFAIESLRWHIEWERTEITKLNVQSIQPRLRQSSFRCAAWVVSLILNLCKPVYCDVPFIFEKRPFTRTFIINTVPC